MDMEGKETANEPWKEYERLVKAEGLRGGNSMTGAAAPKPPTINTAGLEFLSPAMMGGGGPK
jgi:hypothetical protein